MKNNMLKKLSTKLGKVGLVIKKHEPEILVVVGAVGAVTSTVLACKATLKVSEVLSEHKETIDTIHETAAREDMKEKYTAEDEKKDVRIVYTQTALKIAKEYAPAVILGTLSLGCMFASNNMLRKRNAALAVAYATIDKSFKEYRGRVAERFGSEVEQVKAGCVASMGLEYVELGKQTGAMAAKVLKGEAKASEMNFEVISEPSLYINTKAAADVNLTISDDILGKAYQTFDEITVE